MNIKDERDVARQAANVLGALFQVGAPILTSEAVGRVSDENGTLVVPADYAFAIWGPIFLLCLAYAAYQALPKNRESLFLRRVGWFSAAAFFSNGLWEILFPARQFLLAQVVIVVIFACTAVAYLRLACSERGVLSAAGRWLVALPFGLLFGWITAATLVSFVTTLVALGLLEGGTGEAMLGAALLLAGSLVASTVLLAGKNAPPQGYLAYAAAVLWALAAVVVNQYDASVLTTGAALVAPVPVALVVASKLFGGRPSRRRKRALSSDTPA
ncbi:MAG: hypothetical protein AVDCRST_MAG78-2468 [uncultured Rubrobacteraceae bacterium]|uniref:Tryptophan-rich sensory protein n=1 Tax=uncultured Rubrobacteraceae bacterium TaxID=349277 RepID=A0A6J4QMC1_9ACTN|nr:MAG: hypothetical protein AVDCRST_MAG78-2468 [uncultured Rubrobacteraceae bacterium]